MHEPRGGQRLAPEARDELAVVGEVLGQQLDRDVALEARVEGAHDGRHAADAEALARARSGRRGPGRPSWRRPPGRRRRRCPCRCAVRAGRPGRVVPVSVVPVSVRVVPVSVVPVSVVPSCRCPWSSSRWSSCRSSWSSGCGRLRLGLRLVARRGDALAEVADARLQAVAQLASTESGRSADRSGPCADGARRPPSQSPAR